MRESNLPHTGAHCSRLDYRTYYALASIVFFFPKKYTNYTQLITSSISKDPKVSSIMTFDVTDKQYQLKDDIKPDKESTWKHPAEKDGKQRPRLLASSAVV
jgi:hypothetical protein